MHKFKGVFGGSTLEGWEQYYQPTLTFHDPNPPITLENGVTSITGTGTLAADAADVTGSGITKSSGTGALVAGAADITGAGVVRWIGTGALVAGSADVTGTGTVKSSGTGVLAALAAAVSGTGTVGDAPAPGGSPMAGLVGILRRRHWIRRRKLNRVYLR